MNKIIGTLVMAILSGTLCAQIKMKKEKEGVLFTENNQNILFYQVEPKSKDGKYERCNYIHPLWANDGTVLTEDFPSDHLHHRGIFWAWHQVWIGEERIGDPWEIKDFEQKISEVEFVVQKNGTGVLNTEVHWISEKWLKNGTKVPYIRENTTITIHPQKADFRKIDFEIRLLALEENISIGGAENVKGYSGFSVRIKLPEDIKFEGPKGIIKPINTAVESSGYVNMFGSILRNDKSGGIVILDHSDNPDYPQKWILRERRSMQNIVYPGREAVQVSTIEPLVLKYSLMVYSGEISGKKIQKNLN